MTRPLPWQVISIHALRGEGDKNCPVILLAIRAISIHALRGEGDEGYLNAPAPKLRISIHALRGEGDANTGDQSAAVNSFQSTPSVGRAT